MNFNRSCNYHTVMTQKSLITPQNTLVLSLCNYTSPMTNYLFANLGLFFYIFVFSIIFPWHGKVILDYRSLNAITCVLLRRRQREIWWQETMEAEIGVMHSQVKKCWHPPQLEASGNKFPPRASWASAVLLTNGFKETRPTRVLPTRGSLPL